MCGTILLKFGMWGVEGGGHLHYENDLGSTELRMCENRILVLPVNILTVWHAGLLGRMTHYRVS